MVNKSGKGWRQQPLDIRAYSGKRRKAAATKSRQEVTDEVKAFIRSGGKITVMQQEEKDPVIQLVAVDRAGTERAVLRCRESGEERCRELLKNEYPDCIISGVQLEPDTDD